MKKCSYCGAEYPDDAVMCAIDHTPFEEMETDSLAQQQVGKTDEHLQDMLARPEDWTPQALDAAKTELQSRGIRPVKFMELPAQSALHLWNHAMVRLLNALRTVDSFKFCSCVRPLPRLLAI